MKEEASGSGPAPSLRCCVRQSTRENREEFPLNSKGADTTDYRFRASGAGSGTALPGRGVFHAEKE